MAPKDTKKRILDAAEAVFAEHGYAAASLRTITQRAGVNLAGVHYHFGSKQALYGAVFSRRIEPINALRLARLDELERAGPLVLEDVVRAFLEPAVRGLQEWGDGAQVFLQISGRMFSEPGEHWHSIAETFGELKGRFTTALAACLPELEPGDIEWRLHFMVGTMCHALSAGRVLRFMSQGRCDGEDPDRVLAELVPFLTAAVGAPKQLTTAGDRP